MLDAVLLSDLHLGSGNCQARRRACTGAICGHTHHAVSRPDTPVAYFNSGCWTELPCTCLTVQEGTVTLQEFHPSRALALA